MQYVKEYIVDVGKRWLAMLFFIGGDLVAVISRVLGKIILIPWWAWLIIGTVALAWAQFLAYKNVRKELDEYRNPVRGAITKLEREVINLGGKPIKMAELFWKMGDCFLEGIKPGSTPGNIYKVVEGADEGDCKKVWDKLKKRLRLLQLICDAQRPHPFKGTGYPVIITTSLGVSVLNELDRKWRDSDWGR